MTTKEIVESILVPVDFSAHSEAALLFAVECADKMGASITVLHVIHDLGEAPGYYSVKGRKKQLRRMEDVATEMLDGFIQEVQKKYPGLPALHNLNTIFLCGYCVYHQSHQGNENNHQSDDHDTLPTVKSENIFCDHCLHQADYQKSL